MKKLLFFSLLGVALLSTQGCASWQQNKWLSAHHQSLTKLAASNLSPEQKLDGMLEDYVLFMKEDLKFVDPTKGVKFVKKYHDQNEAAMDKILSETAAWQSKMNAIDKVSFGVRAAKKPYIRDVIDLAPKFKKKYKQYAFAVKLATKVSGGLTNIIGKNLFD